MLLLLVLATVTGITAADPFPRPASLEPAIAFWKNVFAQWDVDQVVFVDGYDLSRVYEVHRLPPDLHTPQRDRERELLRRGWKDALVTDLRSLAAEGVDYDALTGRRLRLFRIWDESRDPATYREAANNLRGQRGIRDRFLAGVARSARYDAAFRQVFREEGVPEDLVYLPHIESSYLWNARSYAGALGMWQFMSATARRHDLHVDEAVDQRLDPLAAARAAASYMRTAYEALEHWPLAITSYNHGVDGIKNAVRETGSTDISVIIGTYRGPLFGFAGRNFYPEFLAAKELADSLLANPGSLPLDAPVEHDTFELPAFAKVNSVAKALGVPRQELEEFNPALTRSARTDEAYLPRGYDLRLPPGSVADPAALFATLPEQERPLKRPVRTYRVRSGDNLGLIARKHGTTVRRIQSMNGINNPNRIRVGMVLKLPT